MMEDLITTGNPTNQSVLNRASKDKFVLVLNLPRALKTKEPTNPDVSLKPLEISVFGTIVPTITVPPIQVPYGGQVPNYSSHTRPNYPPLSINFVVDNEYKNYYSLWQWLALLNDPLQSEYTGKQDKNLSLIEKMSRGNHTDYQSTLSILALNEYNQTVIEFVYYYAFITSLGGISYNYRDGEILESSVEFQYSQLQVKRPKDELCS